MEEEPRGEDEHIDQEEPEEMEMEPKGLKQNRERESERIVEAAPQE